MTTLAHEGSLQTKVHRRRLRGMALAAALVAFNAYGGAIGLATGVLDMGHRLNARLPFASPVVGGLALVVFVAMPFTALAVQAWRRDPRARSTAFFAGAVVLIGWIVVELAFIREISFLQTAFVIVGLTFCVAARRGERGGS